MPERLRDKLQETLHSVTALIMQLLILEINSLREKLHSVTTFVTTCSLSCTVTLNQSQTLFT